MSINSSPKHGLLGCRGPQSFFATPGCEGLGGREPAHSHQYLSTNFVAITIF